jgi:hypothetical protein
MPMQRLLRLAAVLLALAAVTNAAGGPYVNPDTGAADQVGALGDFFVYHGVAFTCPKTAAEASSCVQLTVDAATKFDDEASCRTACVTSCDDIDACTPDQICRGYSYDTKAKVCDLYAHFLFATANDKGALSPMPDVVSGWRLIDEGPSALE